MIMEYNKKKMCGSFLSFPFLFDVIIMMFIFEDQYFQGGVLFQRNLF